MPEESLETVVRKRRENAGQVDEKRPAVAAMNDVEEVKDDAEGEGRKARKVK